MPWPLPEPSCPRWEEVRTYEHVLLAGCVEPDLKAKELKEKYGGATPAETVKAMLLPGEIEDLSRAVERLCGFRRITIKEVKNA